jgi:hypothetical protein
VEGILAKRLVGFLASAAVGAAAVTALALPRLLTGAGAAGQSSRARDTLTVAVIGGGAGAVLWFLRRFRQRSKLHNFVGIAASFSVAVLLFVLPDILAEPSPTKLLAQIATCIGFGIAFGFAVWRYSPDLLLGEDATRGPTARSDDPPSQE